MKTNKLKSIIVIFVLLFATNNTFGNGWVRAFQIGYGTYRIYDIAQPKPQPLIMPSLMREPGTNQIVPRPMPGYTNPNQGGMSGTLRNAQTVINNSKVTTLPAKPSTPALKKQEKLTK